MTEKINKKCIVCGKDFLAFPRIKACSPECVREYRLIRARENSNRRYREDPEGCKARVHDRYVVKRDDILAYAKNYRAENRDTIAVKDAARKKKRRQETPPKALEKTCPECGKIFFTFKAPQKYCSDECKKAVAARAQKKYGLEHRPEHYKYVAERSGERRRHAAIRSAFIAMEGKTPAPNARIENPLEFKDIGAWRLDKYLCTCMQCGFTYYLHDGRRALLKARAKKDNPCPFCSRDPGAYGSSSYEHEIRSMFPNFTEANIRPDWLDGKEIDLYDPVRKVGVEICGVRWHSDMFDDKPAGYHRKKADMAEAAGVHLIQVWDHEWLKNREIVIDRIGAVVGSDMERIPARKLEVRAMNTDSDRAAVHAFMDANHIQGRAPCQWAVALFRGEEMVAACTFRYGTGYASGGQTEGTECYWELNRFATLLGTRVQGGLGRCIRAFSREMPDVHRLVSFADRRWTASSSSAYTASGFREIGKVRENYVYTDTNPRHPLLNKQAMRKSNIRKMHPEVYDEKLTEKEMSLKLGFYRLYDAGKIKFEMTL